MASQPSRQRAQSVVTPKARNGRHETVGRARILVADDHQDTRDLLFVVLKTEGYEVALAADGGAPAPVALAARRPAAPVAPPPPRWRRAVALIGAGAVVGWVAHRPRNRGEQAGRRAA